MADNGGPSQNTEPPAPVNGPSANASHELPSVPSFVCVLPCTKQVVKYGDRLEGCVTGIHVTREQTQDIYVLYRIMAETILAKDAQPVGQATPGPCVICQAPIVPSQTAPMIHMEICDHYVHYDCHKAWASSSLDGLYQVDCLRCGETSNRTLLWPQAFPTSPAKIEHFKLQKRSFGIDVAPQTALQVNKCYDDGRFLVYDLVLNRKHLTVRKRHPQESAGWRQPSQLSMREPTAFAPAPVVPGRSPSYREPSIEAPGQGGPSELSMREPSTSGPTPFVPGRQPSAREPSIEAPGGALPSGLSMREPSDMAPRSSVSGREPSGGYCGQRNITVSERLRPEAYLVRVLQALRSDLPRTIYLGNILPLEENVPLPAGLEQPLSDFTKRQKLLFQFRCPFDQLDCPLNGGQCSEGPRCEFWHGWPKNTPEFIVSRVKVRDFPSYFCLKNSRTSSHESCIDRIRVHSEELVRCSAGFHPSTKDLQNMKRFAHKMAKLIMAPASIPEQYPFCAFCRNSAEPNSAWMHLQNCDHWLHLHCVLRVRGNNPKRKLELLCPICEVTSVRIIAWPGPFRSELVKQTIFARQLAEFKLTVQADTQLVITEVDEENVFILDYGGPSMLTFDCDTAQDNSTVDYD